MKIALVGSSGGHLAQLLALKDWWQTHQRFWVTFDKEDARSALRGEEVYWCYHPTNRHVGNLLRNTFLAVKVLAAERPDVIVSSGAGAAVPYFYLGRLVGASTVFIEVVDRIDTPTLTGRLVYPFASVFVVQWESQQRAYPRSILVGELL